jgi:cobyrinic acid a,c-diamide synthase
VGRGAGQPRGHRHACADAADQPARPDLWLGALARIGQGRDAQLLPERHLGLVAAHELPDAMARLNAAADQLADTPLGQMDWAAWQRWSVEFPAAAAAQPPAGQQALQPWLQGRTVAVASDAAFSFIYPANLDCLQAMGANLAFFSPLAGEACRPAMPCGCPAAIRNCMPASWPPTPGCRPICAPMWPQARRCGPNAAACWPWASSHRCARAIPAAVGLLPGRHRCRPGWPGWACSNACCKAACCAATPSTTRA